MQFDNESVSLFVWAVFFGICFAIIFITVQRNALSTFFKGLTDKRATDEDSAIDFDGLEIKSGVFRRVISSAISSHNGIARIVGSTGDGRYYLKSDDAELIKKKYVVRPTAAWKIVISIIILFAVALCSVNVIGWLGKYAKSAYSSSYTDKNKDEEKSEQSEEPKDNADANAESTNGGEQSDTENNDTSSDEASDTGDEEQQAPTIPKGPMN